MSARGRRLATVVLGLLLGACGPAEPPAAADPFAGLSAAQPRDMPRAVGVTEGRSGPTGGVVFDPVSAPIEEAVAYRFSLGHCGLLSPVDVDGSFWDAVDGSRADGGAIDLETDGEMINATAGVIVVIGDEMRFRTDTGSVVRFERHRGDKEFGMCM